jgi:hypothetical protein
MYCEERCDACTGLQERVMPMLFWLPMIFMSAMIELSAPAVKARAPQAD